MTDQQLTGFAYQVANMIKNDMRNTGSCSGVIGWVYSGRLLRLRKMEALIIKTCGEGWLNDDRAKSTVSAFLRTAVNIIRPEAFAFGSVVNRFKSSEKLNALPPERVCLFNQTYDSRERTFAGEPDVQCAPLNTFSGRLNIFGEDSSACQK